MQVALRTDSGGGFAITNRRHGRARDYASLCPLLLSNMWMFSDDAVNRSSTPGCSSGGRSSFATNSVPLSLGNVLQSGFADLLDQVQPTCDQSL